MPLRLPITWLPAQLGATARHRCSLLPAGGPSGGVTNVVQGIGNLGISSGGGAGGAAGAGGSRGGGAPAGGGARHVMDPELAFELGDDF